MYFFISEKIYNLTLILEKIFQNYKNLNIKQIYELLNKEYNLTEINEAINYLLIEKGIIVRDDFWQKDAIYRYVSREYYQNSSLTKYYCSFNVDDYKSKKFLLLSDTHIGNFQLENYELLNNIYNFCIQQGVTKCFHTGDIFSSNCEISYSNKQIEKLFYLFNNFFPKCEEIKTYALLGNHDERINGFFNQKPIDYQYDLRQLNRLNNNFYVILRPYCNINFSNININFAHKVVSNWCYSKKIISSVDQLSNIDTSIAPCSDVLISGHLHTGFICNNKNKLLLGVPSATNININGVVGYIINLNYDDFGIVKNMDIKLLVSNKNNEVNYGETITWNFKEKNPELKKLF